MSEERKRAWTSGEWIVEGVFGNEVKAGRQSYRPHWPDIANADEQEANAYLISAAPNMYAGGEALNGLIEEAQVLIRMFLEPGDHRIQSEKELVSKLIQHFDGPKQREAQNIWNDAAEKARGEQS